MEIALYNINTAKTAKPEIHNNKIRIKRILIIGAIILIVLVIVYLFILNWANLFIKTNTDKANISIDGNTILSDGKKMELTDKNLKAGNPIKIGNSYIIPIKTSKGTHSISVEEEGHIEYNQIITNNIPFIIPEVIDAPLIPAKDLGSPANTDVYNIEYSTYSKDNKGLLYYDDSDNSVKYFYPGNDTEASVEKNIHILDFINPNVDIVQGVKWSYHKDMVLINYLLGDKKLSTIQLFSLDGSKSISLTQKIHNLSNVEFLSNNRLIYITTNDQDRTVYLSDENGDNPQKVSDIDYLSYNFSISPDDKILCYISNKNQGISLNLLDLNTKKITEIITGDDNYYGGNPSWSGDSQRLLYPKTKSGLLLIDKSGSKKNISDRHVIKSIWMKDNKIFELSNLQNDPSNIYLTLRDQNGKEMKFFGKMTSYSSNVFSNDSKDKLYIEFNGTFHLINMN